MRQEKGATTLSLTTLDVTDLFATLSINDSMSGVYYNVIFDILSVTVFIVIARSKCHSAERSYAERSSSEYHFAEGSSSEYHYADRHCNAEWKIFLLLC